MQGATMDRGSKRAPNLMLSPILGPADPTCGPATQSVTGLCPCTPVTSAKALLQHVCHSRYGSAAGTTRGPCHSSQKL